MEVMVVIRVPAFVAAASAAAEAVVRAVLLLRCSLPAQRHRYLRPGGAAADRKQLLGFRSEWRLCLLRWWRLPQAAYAKHGCGGNQSE